MSAQAPNVNTALKRVTVYIDGFNLYHAIDRLGENHLKWLNFAALSKSFARHDEVVMKTYLFTALTYGELDKQERHKTFMAACRVVGVEVVETRFKRAKKYCRKHERYCKFWEEKESDVSISVRMIADAQSGYTDRIVLVTADTDQIPAVEYLANTYPHIELTLYIPPGRKNEARDLGHRFKDTREIEPPRLRSNLLPQMLAAPTGGMIIRPTPYDPPPAPVIASQAPGAVTRSIRSDR